MISTGEVNVHHLELFYFVAKYEGITEAVRKMPYGIQQPAVSGQLLQLEKALGVKLFNRRPFALTPEGEKLYDFAYPFFSRLPDVEAALKGEDRRHLRLAASSAVLRTHLPLLLERMKVHDQDLKLTLREVEPSDVHKELVNQQADIAITVRHAKLTEGLRFESLMVMPLALNVPASWKADRLQDLVGDDGMGRTVGKVPLIGLPENEALMQLFLGGLRQRGLQWETDVEVGSLDTIGSYVASGFGAGLAVAVPQIELPKGVKQIVLEDFEPLEIGLIWQGTLRPMAEWFRTEAMAFAERLKGAERPRG